MLDVACLITVGVLPWVNFDVVSHVLDVLPHAPITTSLCRLDASVTHLMWNSTLCCGLGVINPSRTLLVEDSGCLELPLLLSWFVLMINIAIFLYCVPDVCGGCGRVLG